MIDKEKIAQLIEDELTDDQFIVDFEITPSNQIMVTLDGENGITIDHCVRISRLVEGNLDREEEDFELQVSSAGLGQPLKIHRQFVKNTGKEMEVVLSTGEKLEGILKSVDQDGFELETSKRERVEGHKKKQLITRTYRIAFDEAKTVKNIIKF
ncbi:ribosome assembly cofactor RimP [Sunxiuqinia elliptica]|uniref:Ribosome maturation factor RimP n=1 Tax=Sunxiuqinia elliptica TaxID=655355 RepID=A0A1I2KPG9_9BACT|nr:ribosome assembly cofactor RimP [Sunxiuqinia elliptica]SFF66826.1 ribosome maturation factor RimP [Sunxiuqinia elliptica]